MPEQVVETYYPHLREVLDERFAELSDDQLDAAFESAFGEGVTPAEYEEFFGGLGQAISSFAQKAAPVVASVGQGALSGAAAGSVGGPWTALGGAVLGGVGSALKGHTRGPARDVGNVLSGVVSTAGALTGRGGAAGGIGGLLGRAGQLGGGGSPAAAQLLGLLGRPELRQALASLAGGRTGGVVTGGTPVPPNAFAGLLGALAREAEAEAVGWGENTGAAGYLMNPRGEFVVDPTDPDQRAARLLQLLSTEPAYRPNAYVRHRGSGEDVGNAEDLADFDDAEFDDADDFGDAEDFPDVAELEDLVDSGEYVPELDLPELDELVEDIELYDSQRM